jgi:fibronectin type 3 domain-containing protein
MRRLHRVSNPSAKLSWPANASFAIALSISLASLAVAGCGAPGEPTARSPLVTTTISDLAAHQAGDGVQLAFTMPARSSGGERLISTPAIEILRGTVKADGSPDVKSLRVVDTIPSSQTGKYLVGDKFQFTDPIASQETRARPVFAYAIRTRLSQKRASANSNVVFLRVYSTPEHIAAIETRVTETAIELSWAAINHTSAGEPLAATAYNIYRAELDDAAAETAKRDVSQLSLNGKLQLLASQAENSYSDKSFEFGKTYAYVIRGVINIEGAPLESSDSAPAIVEPRDTFPPAVPQALAAAVLPGESDGALLVDLSWSINVEPDFAGYRVYRSEQQDAKGNLLTPDLLPTPAYRDTSVQPAHTYWYAVAAVDRAGNESAPSPPVSVEIAQPSP